MANIDGLLTLVLSHGADELRLTTDGVPQILCKSIPVRLFLPATPAEMLRHLLEGLLTPEQGTELQVSGKVEAMHVTERGDRFALVMRLKDRATNTSEAIFRLRAGERPITAPRVAPATAAAPAATARGGETEITSGEAPLVELHPLLERAVELRASDLHLRSGEPVTLRVDGRLRAMEGTVAADVEALFSNLLDDAARKWLTARRSIDLAFQIPALGRFRVNLYRADKRMAAAVRVLPLRGPSLAELNLPMPLDGLLALPHGLILVSGPTGAGKSATLAALAAAFLERRGGLLITLEDPIEYNISASASPCLVRQREIGADVADFPTGLRDALREDPDFLLVGEMRDPETISLALTAAETGHLVLASLHSRSSASTIERIIDGCAAERQQQVRGQLADALRAVISQRLLPKANGVGRLPALEVLRGTHTVASLIREGKTSQIATVLQSGGKEGMMPLERCLADLVRSGRVRSADAAAQANDLDALASYRKG
jgi:twitching motility protein PilT